MSRQPPDLFLLRMEDKLLGKVYVDGLWNMPWFKVNFEPTEHFQIVRPLFEKEIQILEYGAKGNIEEVWDEIINRGVRLVRKDDGTVIDVFTLHIDGDHSRLRYVEPSELNNQSD